LPLAGVLLLALCGGAYKVLAPEKRAEVHAPAGTEKPRGKGGASKPQESAAPVLGSHAAADSAIAAPPARRPSAPATVVRFDVPDDVKVFWNGRRVDSKAELRGEKPGAHWLMLEKTGY